MQIDEKAQKWGENKGPKSQKGPKSEGTEFDVYGGSFSCFSKSDFWWKWPKDLVFHTYSITRKHVICAKVM